MKSNEFLLNSVFLKNRILELDLKQWWVAEQIGVDRKTVSRWLLGQVRQIQKENVEALAKLLECSFQELTLPDLAHQTATIEDQKAAAVALIDSSMVEKLGPLGEWNVIESLLKATIVPNLPLNVLGELYDQLTIASWRQSKIDQAEIFNKKTEELALKTGDKQLLASALLSKANILFWRGQTAQSISCYESCLALKKYIDLKSLGSAYSNLGSVYYETGNLEKGQSLIEDSITIFEQIQKPTNLSISYCHLTFIFLKKKNLKMAGSALKKSLEYASIETYRRGFAQGKMLQAEICALDNNFEQALILAEESLSEFANLNIFEGLYFEQAARVYRLSGNFKRAEELVNRGMQLAKNFPSSLPGLNEELKLISQLNRPW